MGARGAALGNFLIGATRTGVESFELVAQLRQRQQQQQAEQKKQGITDQIQNLEKTLTMLQKHSPEDQRIPQLVDMIAEIRIGKLGLQQESSLLGSGDFTGGIAQQEGRTRRSEEAQRVQGQIVAARKKQTARDVGKPSEGLRNSYKKIGVLMVKKADEIAEFKKDEPTETGRKARKLKENFQESLALKNKEFHRLQEKYDKIRTFALSKNAVLEDNEWDVYRPIQLQGPTLDILQNRSTESLIQQLLESQ